MPDLSDNVSETDEDKVLLRMLSMPAKPREKPPESSEPPRRGRPIGGFNRRV
jgi:hypothetical protein